ncbi:MAG: YjjG family noncanonical pyrimidine nucleotidase [Bacteroidota bacterium]|nr:YjjG family noncanonical pyrimidine nucleotidase [Bacteroidota bacterium]
MNQDKSKQSWKPDQPKYRQIFFDLDHTLWDFDANAKESLSELYEYFDLDSRLVTPFELFYKTYLHHNAILWDRFEKGYITSEELKWKRMWRSLLDFKIADETLARQMSAKFLEILPTKKRVFDYTFEILDYLTEKGYGLHLITNGFEKTQRSKLMHSRLDRYFTHVITSETSQSMKPQKEIFEYALKQAHGKAEDSIMIGDNPSADIEGAMNAGIDTVFVNHIHTEIPQKPTYTIYHLKELETIL